jgi:uroporphyrinogen decarboxylase|tara:strand:- start:157 stop:1176 length:1020 start_codon:yes stop_codon:yes gene_type:complete
MRRLNNCLENKRYTNIPIWFMRQAGRYLDEFREIRKKNPNFINLCLNEKLVHKISLQPIKRFDLDAIILFSDILIIPYGLGQKVLFKKNLGPILGNLNLDSIIKIKQTDFLNRVYPVYKSINLLKNSMDYKHKSLIGFAGAPWTLLLYMINKQSPKKSFNKDQVFKDKYLLNHLMLKLEEFICLHIDKQIEAGANIIQLFDSWAGLLSKNELANYCYLPTLKIVNHIKKKRVPIICFPKNIKKEDYIDFCSIVKPSAINIDYEINPEWIKNKLDNLPIQGGLDPKILLTNKENIKKNVDYYLNVFSGYPYIFNLGHGVLPETNPSVVEFIVKTIREKNT